MLHRFATGEWALSYLIKFGHFSSKQLHLHIAGCKRFTAVDGGETLGGDCVHGLHCPFKIHFTRSQNLGLLLE